MIQKGGRFCTALSQMSNLVCKFEVQSMDLLYEIFEELRVMFRLYIMSASKRGRHVKQSPMCFLDGREGLVTGSQAT